MTSDLGHAGTGLLAVRYEVSSAGREKLSLWHDTEFCSELLQVPGVMRVSRYDSAEGEEQLILYKLEHPWVVQEANFARLWTTGWDTRRRSLPVYKRTLYVRIL